MITFILMTLFVVMSPGVDTALITKRTIADGKKDGLQMALGITTGSLAHTLAATLGLSTLILQSAVAFTILKWAGAIYLIYLGIQAFINRKSPATATDSDNILEKKGSAYKEGFLSNLLNPKVAVFFITFLPQFVTTAERAMIELFFMGSIYALLSILWFVFYVFCLHYIREWLLSPTVQNYMEKLTGIVLIGFGIKLLFTQNESH
ncbi:LysE family translocator [Lysinibacillus telephonicus]|uniref:LysE family translocator n=1 Tax=Lysinibacillus telephonicus TaxID=1714840 RepID=A0A431UKN1_9BACI|nr:LysE family translocator [Lysinibacillus telephonicus]RTQ90305.1 LysE family translocator [Lysinibacillus telephonicus]